MKKKKRVIILVIVILVLLAVAAGIIAFIYGGGLEQWKLNAKLKDSTVILYEGPSTLRDAAAEDLEPFSELSKSCELLHCTDTAITINGQECYVYDTIVNHKRNWAADYFPKMSRTPIAYFDFEGMVEVQVTVPDRELNSVKISPLSYNITPEINQEEHTVTFYIDTPDVYTLYFDDSPERAIHLFANALEENVPDFESGDVIYVEPGEWNMDAIDIKSGQTLYLAGGAVVHGYIKAEYADNITVCGRGILDGSLYEGWRGKDAKVPLQFDNCSDITIKDIIVLNSNAWVCQAFNSDNGIIDGLKIISSRPNGDGITIQSCQNYDIRNCFVRSWDDSLVVKNYDRNSENITFDNMQLWTDLAQSMEIGYETNKGQKENSCMSDISFTNITVLQNFHKPVISIHNADDAVVKNILFENIVVENQEVGSGDGKKMPYLIDIAVLYASNWSTTPKRGRIQDITLRNITFLEGNQAASRITGYDAEHGVENVVIENLNMFGQQITSLEEGKFEVDEETVREVTFR